MKAFWSVAVFGLVLWMANLAHATTLRCESDDIGRDVYKLTTNFDSAAPALEQTFYFENGTKSVKALLSPSAVCGVSLDVQSSCRASEIKTGNRYQYSLDCGTTQLDLDLDDQGAGDASCIVNGERSAYLLLGCGN
jgi:hypothetical protein